MTHPSMFNSYSLEMESDRETERLMEAFVPCVREELERRHPEWASIVAKVKSATFLLKRYENRSE